MKYNKRLVSVIAKKFNKDPDELILLLWEMDEKRFAYLRNRHSVIRGNDIKLLNHAFCVSDIEDCKKKIKTEQKKIAKISKEFDFSKTGFIVDTISYITHDEILKIHNALVSDFSTSGDPIFPSGVKNEHLLHSALFHPQTSFGDVRKYATIESSGAALMYAVSNNHPFHNGNKRTALVSLLVFLDRHNIFIICDEDELFKISISIADHRFSDINNICEDGEIYHLANWILQNSKNMKKNEYPITLKKLKRILRHHDCNILDNGKVTRIIKTRSFFGLPRTCELKSKIPENCNVVDGTELSIKTIQKIRKELHLDVENGVDSDVFYQSGNSFTSSSSEFIIKYKNLLTRLSKL